MKKFLSLLLLLALASCLLLIGGCDNEEEVTDMKEEQKEQTAVIEEQKDPSEDDQKQEQQIVDNGKITVFGVIDGKTTLNPAFSWEEGAGAFTVTLKKQSGASVLTDNVTEKRFELSDYLEYGAKYALIVTGADGALVGAKLFETIAGEGTPSKTLSVREPYQSHMVLQRDKALSVCGQTTANALVTVEFHGARYYATSDQTGAFAVPLPALQADATPSDLEIRLLKNKSLTLQDVVVGDVYLFAGQSNMQRGLVEKGEDIADYTQEDIDNAIAAGVRFYRQSENLSATPIDTTVDGKWFKVEKDGSTQYKTFSAIAFMTGSMLGKSLSESGVPIGVLYAAKGDTAIADWVGSDGYGNRRFNAMVHPLRRTELTGVVWYQGCNNSASGIEYKGHLQNLMASWRALFRSDDLPFYVVQLPVYNGDEGNNYDFSYVREAQFLACEEDENAYLIATCDDGDPDNIHPVHKRYIAERLTKSILSTLYGAAYLPQGPTYASHEIVGNKAVVTVNYGEGLHVTEGEAIRGFLLAGEDGKYFAAEATLENGKIVVISDKVAAPVYIKYGFGKCPYLNLYNKDGFLMSPFRTDRYNRNVDLLEYEEITDYTQHPDGSAMTYQTVEVDGEIGLRVTKANDGKDYGAIRLYKWGAIGGKDEDALTFTFQGTNSGADVLFRIVEGSWEIWAIDFKDDSTDKRTFTVYMSDFACVYNNSDEVINYQKIMNLEVMLKSAGEATVTVLGAKFTTVQQTAPRPFTIKDAQNDGHECVIKYEFSTFADRYRVIVSTDGKDFTAPVYDAVTDQIKTSFDAALCEEGKTYYVKVIAQNDLGETVAENSGFVMNTLDRYAVASFDFADDSALQNYVKENMIVHKDLILSRDDKGLKINVSQKNDWMHCIVKAQDGANQDYSALKFYMDLTEYNGSVNIQLQDKDGSISFGYDLSSSKKEGYFEIPLSAFKNKNVGAFDGRKVGRIAFNFTDYVGGASDNVYLNYVEYIK